MRDSRLAASGEDPIPLVVLGADEIGPAASRRLGIGESQEEIVEIFRRLKTEVVEISGSIDGRDVHERDEVVIGIDHFQDFGGFFGLIGIAGIDRTFPEPAASVEHTAHQ